ncbi:MAG: damage-inducible protein DinB [Paenibacillus sp.]|jgi:uncharacterized damage-inducible protein DinB|nr:damage-inducible protein DinB [Paenibacillus sp.]
MKSLFLYNWEVRDEWFKSLSELSTEELLKDRYAGVGSIIKTFLHILDVEYSWIRALLGRSDISHNLEDYRDLDPIKTLSDQYKEEILEFLDQWNITMELEEVKPSWMLEKFKKGEVLRHLIAHEIHHIGQLSIWAKELGIKQVSSNFIGRDILKKAETL